MSSSKVRLANIITILFSILILLNLFVLNIGRRIYTMIFCLILLVIYLLIFGYKKNQNINRKQVSFVMLIFGIIQIALWFLLGIIYSFGKNLIQFNLNNAFLLVIPTIVSIICIEVIRYITSSEYERNKIFKVLITILFILIDVQLLNSPLKFADLSAFLQFIGFILFPSVVYNVVFNKTVLKYGFMPNILYRSVIILAYYVLPILPEVYGLFRAIGKITIPLIMYMVIDYMYTDKKLEPFYINKNRTFKITTIISCILIAIFGALISLNFKYGVIIVGSGSMTGTINYGDMTFIEQVDPETLEIGDVIVYEHDGRRIVHRITEIGVFNGDYVFTTKGDANAHSDDWYVYKDKIIGKVDFVVKYIGLPTLWLRSIFE